MNEMAQETIIFVALVALIGWVLWLLFRRHQINAQARLQRIDSFNRLLEKFGSAKEFVDFAHTDQGRKFLEDPLPKPANPMRGVLRFLQIGIILIALSYGFFMNSSRLKDYTDINYVRQAMDFKYWGTLLLALGAGLILVAGISSVIAKKWHLLKENSSKKNPAQE